MAIVESFPYSNQHNLNLDWMISKLNEYAGEQITNIEVETIDASHFRFKFTYASGGVAYTDPISMVGGPQGPSGTITVGTVTTVDPTDPATVTNSGTNTAAIFDFEIPKGDKGDTGDTGPAGTPGGITDIDGYTGPVTTSDGIDFDTSTGILKSYDFNLTDTDQLNINTLPTATGLTAQSGVFAYALNADKSIGKLYGLLSVTIDNIASTTQIKIPIGTLKVAAPAASYSIRIGTIARDDNGVAGFGNYIVIDANGQVNFQFSATTAMANKKFWCELPACIYFFKDFGDNP